MSVHCVGCIYWRRSTYSKKDTDKGFYFCHYALDNHKCRLVPAENCPYKDQKKEVGGLGKKFSEEEAQKLYDAGKNDCEIGAALGVNSKCIQYWRRKQQLKSNTPPGWRKKKKKAMAMQIPDPEKVTADVFDGIKDGIQNIGKTLFVPIPDYQQTEPEIQRMNEPINLAEEYDPLIYDAFDLAIAKCYERGLQPGLIWRKLLWSSEEHLCRLRDYLPMSEEACRCAIELAALAAVESTNEDLQGN